jgi:indolepyruvate ferredoxin oxidoreductase
VNMPVDVVLRDVKLDDKYTALDGSIYLTGTQALVLLPLLQRRRDLAAGLNTASYISGYRGSPVGGYDQALWKAQSHLAAHHVKFQPGLNEDLAATAIWGTQQLNSFEGANYDGIVGFWYGKGPGVDRSGDALRHANQAGTSKHGGVLAIGGDDHGAKSSTMAAQVDYIFSAVSMPILAPATVQDYIDYGLHGIAMSRFSGLWIGIKAVTDTIEASGVVDITPERIQALIPTDVVMPQGGLNLRWPEEPFLKLEERLDRYKIPAALAYAKLNQLNRNVFGVANTSAATTDLKPCLGIVSSGKSWLDVMQALADLGIDEASAKSVGLKVMKVAMPWPLEPSSLIEFASGCSELFVIEEKRALIESQAKEILYGLPNTPRVLGKQDEKGQQLVPSYGEVSPSMCAQWIAARLAHFAAPEAPSAPTSARIAVRLAELASKESRALKTFETIDRIPYFCSGCPHNTSTRVPEGSRALAGIGCHYMAQWMDRSTATFTQMGGEGMAWVGQAPFSSTKHVFQNIGDGTYFHSGSLAIRHAVSSKTCITYKILFNDAVAMTGGQKHDGQLTPQAIARQVAAEGVEKIVVVTDDPEKYPAGYFDAGVTVFHRTLLDEVQRTLREYDGVSVLVYDQTCAAEKRRRRKRNEMPDPKKRAFINEAVCEGCGDCGVQSNCVSIEPVETEFGRKREINQSSCNKDFSCVTGFCPSFVTVEGGKLKRGAATANAPTAATVQPQAQPEVQIGLPSVTVPEISASGYSLLVTGIGGTGVVTIGQLLGMAAHLEGKAVTVLDMAGLAQKNGAVMSFVRFGNTAETLYAPRIGVASADAVLGCDVVVTASKDALSKMLSPKTRAVVNTASIPTADFTRNADWKFPSGGMEDAISQTCGQVEFVPATQLATALLGDSIAANLFMLGFGWQRGLVPLSVVAIERAIELNEVAVDANKRAFLWGRRAAVDLAKVTEVAQPAAKVSVIQLSRKKSESLDEIIARRSDFLHSYQDAAYTQRYLKSVELMRRAEMAAGDGATKLPLTAAVARYLFKLMSYKDEYEVARLYSNGQFKERVSQVFEGDFKLKFHLAPPLLSKRNAKGELQKSEYGPWILSAFSLLACLRFLRGGALDVFGRSAERQMERRLIADYEQLVQKLASSASFNTKVALDLLCLPEQVRGFGHVKEKHVAAATLKQQALMAELWQTPIEPNVINLARPQPQAA